MAEHDNAGFPLTYCLLSTATAIDQVKCTKVLSAWAKCLCDKYGAELKFIHVDKDMAEIGCSKMIWTAKINLCWWHLRRAVRTRLAKGKLSTTPYNLDRARAEYQFISADFIPPGTRTDIDDYEGGLPDDQSPASIVQQSSSINQPANPSQPPALAEISNSLKIKFRVPDIASAVGRVIRGVGFKLTLAPTKQASSDGDDDEVGCNSDKESDADGNGISLDDDDADDGKPGRHTFCPELYRNAIVNMMEKHYCAHPLIPGYSRPHAIGIKQWAVQSIYNFCVKHELPEVWVYLWENWYHKGRWELWARSGHEMIPVFDLY